LQRVAAYDSASQEPVDAPWLAWRFGVSPAEAREYLRVAQRLAELPAVEAAFAQGELSYTKVRTLTRFADPECEEELVELAELMTASQLVRALRAYQQISTEEAREAQEREFLRYFWEEDGCLRLAARLPGEEGALLLRALEAAREAVRARRRDHPGDPPEPAEREPAESPPSELPPPAELPSPEEPVTNAEALVAVAELALAEPGQERAGAERSQLVVHVDAAALAADQPGRCELEAGPALAAETARRLGCDASLVTLFKSEGRTLSVGRKTRTVPAAMRRALDTRDRVCRFPGCENQRFLDAHHLQHWAQGGETRLDNLILLCRRHHRHLHEGEYTIDQRQDGELRFRNRYGVDIPCAPRPPPTSAESLLEQNRNAGLTIDEKTNRNGLGERMSLDDEVFRLRQILG
jgi:hypothetical protein